MSQRTPGFNTLAVHAGAKPDPATGARATLIYQTTSFVFDDADHAASLFGLKAFGNIYTRIMNPTQAVLEERVAALEGGTAALAVASGHAAQMLVFHTIMRPGDNFVAARRLYGGSINQFGHAFKNFGWEVRWADTRNVPSFETQIDDKTRAIFVESLANPNGEFVDLEAIGNIARKHGIPLIVDNTLATPYLVRPIEHGADIVVHSLTKFIGGHGNSIGGVLVDGGTFDWSKSGNYPMLSEPRPEYGGIVLHETFGNFAFAIAARVLGLRDMGPAISPFNAFLILTGLETLPLRMQRHCDNAPKGRRAPVEACQGCVGLLSRPAERLRTRPWRRNIRQAAPARCSPSVSKGGYEAGVKFVEALELFSHLANVGDTKSLVIHPASTTHRQLSDEQKIAAGAGPDTVRLSIGIEDAADIIADLDQALAKA